MDFVRWRTECVALDVHKGRTQTLPGRRMPKTDGRNNRAKSSNWTEDLLLITESGLKTLASPDATVAYRARSKKRKERLSIVRPKVLQFSLFVNGIFRSLTSPQSSELSGQSFSPSPRSDEPIAASCSQNPTWQHLASVAEWAAVRIQGRLLLSGYPWLGQRHGSSFRGKLRQRCPHNRLLSLLNQPRTMFPDTSTAL